MITTERRTDTTVITAKVSEVPTMESKTYRADSGVPFIPERVVLTLYRQVPDKWMFTAPVEVKVTGANILKSGKPGQQTLGRTFSENDVPLDSMPEWLATWVQNAPDELKGNGDA